MLHLGKRSTVVKSFLVLYRWLLDELNRRGFSRGLSDWISSNLQRQNFSSEEMTWIFNVEGAAEMYESYK